MPDNVISIVNQMGLDHGSPEGIFCNIHKELSVEDLYDDFDLQDDSSCASNKSWNSKKDGGQDDNKNIAYDDDMEHDEINDLNEDLLHLRNGLGDNINNTNNKRQYIEEGGILNKDEEQGNHFGNANNIPLGQNEHFGGANNKHNDYDENNDINNENQDRGGNNHHQVSDNDKIGNSSYDDDDRYDDNPKYNDQSDHDLPEGGVDNSEHEEREEDNVDEP